MEIFNRLILIIIFTNELGANKLRPRHFSPGSPQIELNYKVGYFEQRVDHFGYVNPRLTFKQRYVISEEHWCESCPIFLFLGLEGDIIYYVNTTGFLWEQAPRFRAMVLFIEHRYYGKSFPFGKYNTSLDKIGYLTVGQALQDYAEFIKYIRRTKPLAYKSPIILFGVSYGGMLAFWFRMKYPFLSTGALSSSAPIFQFPGIYDCNGFNDRATKDFAEYSWECAETIRRSWKPIRHMLKTGKGRKYLSKTFRLCKLLEEKDSDDFVSWIDCWGGLAMVDYPNPTPTLPAYPVGEVCKLLRNPNLPPHQLVEQIYQGVSVNYNYTGDVMCNNIKDTAESDVAWEFQTCTEMVLPFCSNGRTDMFEPDPWNTEKYTKDCFKQFGVRPDYDKAITMFGGFDFKSVTNVIFTNGLRDPWAPGGLLHTVSPSLIALNISHACHHEDTRFSGKNDPPPLRAVRQKISSILNAWVKQHYRENDYFPQSWIIK